MKSGIQKRLGFSLLGIFSLLLLTAVQVNANTISYGNLVGIKMQYIGVQETSMTDGDTAPLYGAPTLSGDSLLFNSMTFRSQASNGGTDQTDGKLDATIESKNNVAYYIDKIRFREFGDTTLSGTGTAATRSSVMNTMFITISEVDNVPLEFPEMFGVNMVFPTSEWTLAGGPITGALWNGTTEVNLTTYLASVGINGHATRVSFTMDNTLTTQSEANTTAYIAKKAAGLTVTPILIDTVPEPTVLSLLLLGGLVCLRKRE